MKSTIFQEIENEKKPKRDEHDADDDTPTSNNPDRDYPKNIENYYALLRALYDNNSTTTMQSCERKSCDSLKENQICATNNAEFSNQHRKDININIKNEPNNSEADIIINSLDVSINGSYGNINKVSISCTTTPTKAVPVPVSSSSPHSNHQIVTSSSTLCDNNFCHTKTARASLASHQRVVDKKFDSIPDDIAVLLDYRQHTTCNNNFVKYTSSEDDVDYHVRSIDYNKRNSTGDIKPITSTYLLMTRSMGLTDEDALNLVSRSVRVIYVRLEPLRNLGRLKVNVFLNIQNC